MDLSTRPIWSVGWRNWIEVSLLWLGRIRIVDLNEEFIEAVSCEL